MNKTNHQTGTCISSLEVEHPEKGLKGFAGEALEKSTEEYSSFLSLKEISDISFLVEKSFKKSSKDLFEEPSEESSEELSIQSLRESTEDSPEEISDQSSEESIKDSFEELSNQSSEESIENSSEELSDQSSEESRKDSSEELSDQSSEESSEELLNQSSEEDISEANPKVEANPKAEANHKALLNTSLIGHHNSEVNVKQFFKRIQGNCFVQLRLCSFRSSVCKEFEFGCVMIIKTYKYTLLIMLYLLV